MNSLPIVIEICGIPYSRKTSTITKMAKHLRSSDVKFEIIDEFRGENRFYETAKYGPDLNIVRALKCLDKIVTLKHTGSCDVILIDRGVFDSYCWLNWFEKRNKTTPLLMELSINFIEVLKYYSNKYHIAWMDIDPLVSIAQHSHQGNIVNLTTLEELKAEYQNAKEANKISLNITRVESEKAKSDVVAARLVQQFKLIKGPLLL